MRWSKVWQSALIIPLLLGVFAFSLRIWQNTISPPSPYWEEVALGYDAYSILKTGHDHHGNWLPLVAFPSFGDFKPSLYFYAVVPSLALFGLNTFAVRLPAVLASTATVVVLYWLMKKWSNERSAFWSAFLLAIQPWSWQVGRVGFEVNLAVLLLSLGVLGLVNAIELWPQKKRLQVFGSWSIVAVLSFAGAMYTYHAARLLAPLFGLLTLGLTIPWQKSFARRWQSWLKWLPAIGLGFLVLAPLLLALTSPVVQQRFQETSILANLEPVERSNELRAASGNTLWSRVVYHRYVFWAELLANNYLKHLSPQFLFGTGDANPRHLSQFLAALYPWEALTILLGVMFGKHWFKRSRDFWLLVGLTLTSPIAAMLTTATPHALRALPLSVWLAGWSGLGTAFLLETLQQQWSIMTKKLRYIQPIARYIPSLFFVFSLICWGFLWVFFRYQYRVEFANEWQYGYQQLVQAVNHHQQPDETVYISRYAGRPAMYFFFYNQVDPRTVQAANDEAKQDQQELLEFGSWQFVDRQPSQPGLYAMPADAPLPPTATNLDSISNLKGEKVWIVYRL